MDSKIIIKGANEHNLKNLYIEIPRNKMIVITGVSGSGKTSLAFDTIYAEGQRRYIESLSSYARQFLGQMKKPKVESIKGLSPSISIDQKQKSKNPRSTVGTTTEVYDYLRLLYSKIGKIFCPNCHEKIKKQTIPQMINMIMKTKEQSRIYLLSPIIRGSKGEYVSLFSKLKKEGYSRVRVNGELKELSENFNLEKNKKHNIDIIVDRLIIKSGIETRLADSLELTLKLSNGRAIILNLDNNKEVLLNENLSCSSCDTFIEEVEPRLFSFNSPYGSCPECTGLGFKQNFSEDLIIPNKNLSINEGAISVPVWHSPHNSFSYSFLKALAEKMQFSLDTPYKNLSEKQKQSIMHGSEEKIKFLYSDKLRRHSWHIEKYFEGISPWLKRRYKETSSEIIKKDIENFMEIKECEVCFGKKLRKEALSIYINNKNISEVSNLSIEESLIFFKNLKLNKKEIEISSQILKEIILRLEFLNNVGLNYLTLSRGATTLSGGESQRIRLATQIGSGLVGVLYVLDEPSIGLHQKDNLKLIKSLSGLRDIGNTLIIVEHDEETILAADFLIDMGPYAGKNGGYIVAKGTPDQVINTKDSLTGEYLSKKREILIPKTRKKKEKDKNIIILGAKANNLKNINVTIPIGLINVITGVSGSGKSTLVNEILYKGIFKKLNKSKIDPGKHNNILGVENIDKIINIDQSPIGRTPRSNPATYTGIFDLIRDLFSLTKEAKARGYKSGRFSFNVRGGRCENCKGDGVIKIEMHFLPDIYVTCDVCSGKRYNKETLDVYYKNKNIFNILDMTIEESYIFFQNIPNIKNKLKILIEIGLGYMKLGQSSTTLSGGEAQRIKLSKELSKKGTGKTIYILDEPTTGLHFYDIEKLINIVNTLSQKGNTIVIIEHNLDVIKIADNVIDLGPEGGKKGGFIIAEGTPEEISLNKKSYTGLYLKKILKGKRK